MILTFIYELDPYGLKIYRMRENELFTSKLSKVIDRHDRNYYHSRFAGGNYIRNSYNENNTDVDK